MLFPKYSINYYSNGDSGKKNLTLTDKLCSLLSFSITTNSHFKKFHEKILIVPPSINTSIQKHVYFSVHLYFMAKRLREQWEKFSEWKLLVVVLPSNTKMRDGMVWSINEDRKAKPKLEKKGLIKKWFFHEMIDYLKLGLKNKKNINTDYHFQVKSGRVTFVFHSCSSETKLFVFLQKNFSRSTIWDVAQLSSSNILEVMIERRNFLKKPPYTKAMSDEELQKISIAPLKINISSNSVLTERMIRTVDQVAEKSTSPKMRDGMVRSINEDQKAKPKLEKKEDLIKKWFFHEMINYLKLGLKNQIW